MTGVQTCALPILAASRAEGGSLADLDATVKLLARFACDLDEDACFVPGMGDAVTEGDGAGAESAAQMQFDETGVE